ncbi:unnamed protein product [Hymenolepis diminuta]|uniref:Uncharacterized protein n=1 Tax=Hymenolepis diminuta TaxID=6216 RepID=A0A564YSC2_HYMDI|nr:unnamed protein product [Hymenolepis diminuta]
MPPLEGQPAVPLQHIIHHAFTFKCSVEFLIIYFFIPSVYNMSRHDNPVGLTPTLALLSNTYRLGSPAISFLPLQLLLQASVLLIYWALLLNLWGSTSGTLVLSCYS